MQRRALLRGCVAIALAVLSCALFAPVTYAAGWLSTAGNHIVDAGAQVWIGRGANLHDTRSCGASTAIDGMPLGDNAAGIGEIKRRIDILTDQWHANFIRLVLEARRPQDAYDQDANYRARVKEIVDYIGTKPGVYVLVSPWIDPTFDANGWPTAGTNAILAKLAQDFYAYPYVMFGVSNEPESNWDGAQDAAVWTRMNSAVAAIRAAEAALGPNRHIVTVQGTRDWARDLSYYIAHPIAAGGGANVAYETHVYNSPGDFGPMLLPAAAAMPVVIGEFGPIDDPWHHATVADMQTLIDLANANGISHLAWTFHHYCPPNLIADRPNAAWDANSPNPNWIGMPLYPTDFGQLLIANWQGGGGGLANTSFDYNVTSTDDNKVRVATALVTRLANLGAEKRPLVVLMPGWGGVGDVPAARDAQTTLFADNGYVVVNVGFHQTDSGAWFSDLGESVKAALDALCALNIAECSAVILAGTSYGGTQTHPVVRFLRANGVFDGSGGANGGRRVVGILGQDSGYTLYWAAPHDADATAYSIAMIENLGDEVFPVDSCEWDNCGARNRADHHQAAPGSQFVLSHCPPGGSHGNRGYANWDAWVLSAAKTMLHNQRGVAKFAGYVEPTIPVSNACVTNPVVVQAPTVATNPASAVGQGGATLNGTVASNGGSTTVSFQYGLTAVYGSTMVAAQSPLPPNAVGTAVSATIGGLACGTQYHFRTVGANSAGTSFGADRTFTTGACDQTIAFGAAPSVVAGGTGVVSATATSGLPVAFTSQTPVVCSVSGTTATGIAPGVCTIAANQAGNANYNPAPQVTQSFSVLPPGAMTLTVAPRGTGIGRVTSNLAGIDCGGDCSEGYAWGTVVTLTAATPYPGSAFAGWGGACVGIGTCTVTMTAARSVTATFVYVGSVYSYDYVQKAYVAYYGRPADPPGQAYWAGQMDAANQSLAFIDAFGNSEEFNLRYGGLSNRDLVTRIYQQALGRDPDQAGLEWYVGELEAGRRTLQTITLDVLNGATTPPDSTVVANKLAVAAYFTGKVANGCGYGPEADGVAIVTGVLADPATVITAKAAIDVRCGN